MQQEEQQIKENEPKEDRPIVKELSFDRPDYVFLPKGNHMYRQEGYFLICRSCDLTHAAFIGKDKIMVGEQNGQPIIKKRKELKV